MVPGEKMKLHHSAVRSFQHPGSLGRGALSGDQTDKSTRELNSSPNQFSSSDSTQTLPLDTPLSQPYWLREEGTTGLFRVDDPSLIGRPENPPAFPVEQVFEIGGQTLVVPDEPVQVTTNSAHSKFAAGWR